MVSHSGVSDPSDPTSQISTAPNSSSFVEVDGASHEGREHYDEVRDRYIRALGIEVIRFSDFKVDFDEESVVARLEFEVRKRAMELGLSPPVEARGHM